MACLQLLKFQGKLALITDSGTGIGQTIARRFVENGASVVILGRRKEPLVETKAMLEKIIAEKQSDASVKIYDGVDASDAQSINNMFDALKNDGATVDYLINNVDVSDPVICFASAPLDEFKNTVRIHLAGTFWTSVQGIRVMKEGAKIITISTFFTEENPFNQRPYRFRSAYTAAQGAKNRLAETMSLELEERRIISIVTNPASVHSDRICKTAYLKDAAEVMRVHGFEDLEPTQVEEARDDLLDCVESDGINKVGVAETAQKLANGRDVDKLTEVYTRLLEQIQSLAEKTQNNTSHIIANKEFLKQDRVVEKVLDLCGDEQNAILNRMVIPMDRVFYPVEAYVTNTAPSARQVNFAGKAFVFTIDATDQTDVARVEHLAAYVEKNGGKVACLISNGTPQKLRDSVSGRFHFNVVDITNPEEVSRWLNTAKSKLGEVLAVIHVTGNLPDIENLTGLSMEGWEEMTAKFITTPATVAQEALEYFVPGGRKDPRKFRDAAGSILIIGPVLPVGRNVPEVKRMQAEVFRGALRPFTTTVNRELRDVLKSRIMVFTVLPGSVTGAKPDNGRVADALNFLVSPDATTSSEAIFCVDEETLPIIHP